MFGIPCHDTVRDSFVEFSFVGFTIGIIVHYSFIPEIPRLATL